VFVGECLIKLDENKLKAIRIWMGNNTQE